MHLAGHKIRTVYADRLRGYKDALADFEIAFDENLIYTSTLSEAAGTAAAEHILAMEKADRPDAVFSAQ
jgi:LacI family transcriptional regulator